MGSFLMSIVYVLAFFGAAALIGMGLGALDCYRDSLAERRRNRRRHEINELANTLRAKLLELWPCELCKCSSTGGTLGCGCRCHERAGERPQ